MAGQLELMLEAERRGILPADKAALLGEARRRGLVPPIEAPAPAAPAPAAPEPAWYSPQGLAQNVGDVLAGGVRGAGGIGATLIRPFESAEENAARRRAMDEALQSMGARPESFAFGAGKFGTELAGTAGVGGLVAKPLGMVAAAAPATAKYIAPVTAALESYGFSAGPATGLKALGARAVGGGVTGATTAGLIEPGEAQTGAGVGAAVGLVAPKAVNLLARGAGFVNDAIRHRLPAIKAGAITREVAGDRIGAIRAALTAAPADITAAQAAAGVQKDAWQALGAMAGKTDEMSALLKRQAADDLAELQRLAEGGNMTEARAAYEQSIARLNRLTEDMRSVELQAANQAAQTMNRLAPLQAQREAAAVNALRGGMPPPAAAEPSAALRRGAVPGEPMVGQAAVSPATEAAQQRALQAAGKPGWLSSGQRAQEWQETADMFANIAQQRRAEASFFERQIGSLESHGLRPLSAQPLLTALDAKIASPGLRASSNTVNILQAVKDDIATLTAKGGGTIDAYDLYTLRKEGINERIRQIMGQTDPKVSAKVTRKVLEEVRPLIDDAIEKAGGTGWRDYLKTYSQSMQAIDQKAMAAEAMRLFKDSPQEYVRLVRGNNFDAVEAIFGPGSFDIFKEMSSKMPTLSKIASHVERDVEMGRAATAGAERLGEIVDKHTSKFKLAWHALSAKTAIANRGLEAIEKRINAKTMEKLREGMMSGQSALEMLNTLPTVERNQVLRALIDPASWKQKGAVAARAATISATNALAPESENALNR